MFLADILMCLLPRFPTHAELATLAVYVLASLFPERAPERVPSVPSPSPTGRSSSPMPSAISRSRRAPRSSSSCPASSNTNNSEAEFAVGVPEPAQPSAHVELDCFRTQTYTSTRSSTKVTAYNAYPVRLAPAVSSAVQDSDPTAPCTPSLHSFVAHILIRTKLAVLTFHQVLILLSKLRGRYPGASGTSLSGHRLFVAGAMVACEMDVDDAYSNRSWMEVCQGLFTIEELRLMKIEVLATRSHLLTPLSSVQSAHACPDCCGLVQADVSFPWLPSLRLRYRAGLLDEAVLAALLSRQPDSGYRPSRQPQLRCHRCAYHSSLFASFFLEW